MPNNNISCNTKLNTNNLNNNSNSLNFYSTFPAIFCNKAEETVLNKDAIADIFGYEVHENDNMYDALKNNLVSIIKRDKLSDKMYLQNRKDIFELIHSTIISNYFLKDNDQVYPLVYLIGLFQNNGIGKSRVLSSIQHFIKNIEDEYGYLNICYTNIADLNYLAIEDKSFSIFLLEQFKSVWNLSSLKVNTSIDFNLEELALNIHKYLCHKSTEKESKEAFSKIISFYLDSQIIKYIKPPGQIVIFRIDEIGKISTVDITNDNIILSRYSDFISDFQKLGFKNSEISKYIRLYQLRHYISLVSKYKTIEFLVAGKDSLLPFMGHKKYNISPCKIKAINLIPLHNSKYIEKILIYKAISKSKSEFVKCLKDSMTNFSKEEFNEVMNYFYDVLTEYSGGYPRLLEAILIELEKYDNLSYFFKKELSKDFRVLEFKRLFNEMSDNLFKEYSQDIFERFNDDTFINALYKLTGIKLENNNSKLILGFLIMLDSNFISNTSNHGCKLSEIFLKYLLSQFNYSIFKSVPQIEITIDDILTSIGLPYKIVNKNIHIVFPEYLKLYINKIVKTKEQLDQEELNFIASCLGNSEKQNEAIVYIYFYKALKTHSSETNRLFGYADFKYEKVYGFFIEGSVDEIRFAEDTASQIKDAIKINKIDINKTALCVYPLKYNNLAIDCIILIPRKNSQQIFIHLFAGQMKDLNEGYSLGNQKNLEYVKKGIEFTKSIASNLSNLGIKNFDYLFVSNEPLKDSNNKNVKLQNFIVCDTNIINKVMIEDKITSTLKNYLDQENKQN